jgi:hypothetical protein
MRGLSAMYTGPAREINEAYACTAWSLDFDLKKPVSQPRQYQSLNAELAVPKGE